MMGEQRPFVIITTDGSCKGNPGPGGWAAVLRFGKVEKILTGNERSTTNNRMELTAALSGLRALKVPCKVVIITDSKYLINGLTKWISKWKSSGWVGSSGKPMKNRDLWEALDQKYQDHEVEFIWTKGHAGDRDNERANALARRACLDGIRES